MKDVSIKKSTVFVFSVVVTLISIYLAIPHFMNKDAFKDLITKIDASGIGGYYE